ncbi:MULTISPECIES: cysteine--tRNA ligase [unclassified Pseudodesulfovibrio]|uniref:cysteine--tRNA ligase n=1 Tax=unclassified Pseudodesulfovibrio TaxID=2661612 RepID=UPI000FEB9045|nr:MULTISPECIES: cysteine--tRNA ligase [unclassified Pseudodesulfovibrio]MCJ2166069.1 cysteine--tRNA ligase [Pseudodesulfovibrio sp. S3-i]RWU02514.1 cysteine--tRNA ligase [Pseudodesulfovibrio sp. S3]
MRLYNTLKRQKEEFIPANGNDVNMYVCGITAYDLCHIGHARSSVVFDVLYRYLGNSGYNVNFIRNFTDVDDKIIKRANEVGKQPNDIAEQFIGEFYVDMDKLAVLRPTVEPKCTEHIPEMIALTERLIQKGHAYATPSGDVYFKVRSFEGYGKLSGRNIDELESGARIDPGEEKLDPLDFALWKGAKPGEPFWESPWGQGRPGWHLECSAMSEKYASLPLDIHGGGQDLSFPHHENEVAQSEADTGKTFANYWVHNGFVQINSEKMSKSLGNFFTIRDILDKFLPETLRYFLLTMHYRSPLDFSFDALEEAEKGIKRIYSALAQIDAELAKTSWKKSPFPEELLAELNDIEKHFTAAMEDDLNTAGALGHVFSAIRLAGRVAEDKNLRKSEGGRDFFTRIKADVADWAKILGIFEREPVHFLTELRDNRAARAGIDPAKVQELLDARKQARADKDFEKSDAIRDELATMQVEVKDTPQGATWDVL